MRVGRTLSPGHPDRACDILAETIVDEYLRRDPTSSLRVHVTGGRGALFVTGVVSSKADFDVGAIVTRTAAQLGAREPVEPFVALESVAGAELLQALRSSRPIAVVGYATNETPEGLPRCVSLSRRLAKKLEDLRQHDPEWFWLEPAFEVNVVEEPAGRASVSVSCAHGDMEWDSVRVRVKQALESLAGGADIKVNPAGQLSSSGLDHDIGASGVSDEPYGSGLPPVTVSGLDPSHPRKFGSWMARELARNVLERSESRAMPAARLPPASRLPAARQPDGLGRAGTGWDGLGRQAVLVRAVYEPGKAEPEFLSARDERGRELARPEDKEALTYYALKSRFRHGLNVDACRWGFAGEAGLPWEE